MNLLALNGLGFTYGDSQFAVSDVSSCLDSAGIVALIGPNGAGKSTLLDLIAGLKAPTSGTCQIHGEDTASLTREQLARLVAHVPQQLPQEVPFTVEDVIMTGRLPHSSGLFESAEDEAALERAIAKARLETFRRRPFAALSGGEKQRVLLAAAMCQEAAIFLLDEPSAHLDPENQVLLWEMIVDLKRAGHLILVATHHLSLAAQHSDRIWLMNHGRLVADSEACAALQLQEMEEVFRVPFHWHKSDEGRLYLNYGR